MNYQEETKKTRLPTYSAEACVLGLLAEAGEVAAVFQKLIRGDYTPQLAEEKLKYELGDILWHVAEICNDNNWTLNSVMEDNLNKLKDRALRKALLGSGDNR
jgi:hypothetical protein